MKRFATQQTKSSTMAPWHHVKLKMSIGKIDLDCPAQQVSAMRFALLPVHHASRTRPGV